MSLLSLFISAFISSTLFPGGSELGLIYLAQQQDIALWLLILVASAGNTLGGMTSWGLGRLLAVRYPAKVLKKPSHQKALYRLERYGSALLLLSWLPLIGDPLCVAAGWLRINVCLSLIFIGLGKTLRYLFVIYLFS